MTTGHMIKALGILDFHSLILTVNKRIDCASYDASISKGITPPPPKKKINKGHSLGRPTLHSKFLIFSKTKVLHFFIISK